MDDALSRETARLLTSEPLMAHLATCVDGRPHVAPVWYQYREGVVEVLTSGRKLANIKDNPRVALSVQKDVGGNARWTVTLLGRGTVIEDEPEIEAAAARINPKYGADPSAWGENVLVRIEVGTATSRTY